MSQSQCRGSHVARWILETVLACVLLSALVTASRAAPPANDQFANATTINTNTLPFSQTTLITEATTENGEYFYCSYSYQTIWYRMAPTTDMWLSIYGSGQLGEMTIFRDNGSGLGGLTQLGCTYQGPLTFLAHAGDAYYLQAGAYCCYVYGSISLSVQQVAPPVPVAVFYVNPSDPSSYDYVQFYDQSYDPGQQGIATRRYDFGDGTSTDSTCCPQHRFAADGDYTVQLTVTTTDGRTGTAERTVSVRTHDVAIRDFRTPQTAHVGQTKQITVSVSNTRYPEMVRVELLKGLPGSNYYPFETIGTLTQFVQARGINRPTDFAFSYTLSPDDAKLGKLTFKAVATLIGSRDAYIADNEALSPLLRMNSIGPVPYSGEVYVNANELEFGILGVLPNPVHGGADLAVRLALATEGAASIQVLDIAGRVVTERDLGVLPPGVHDARVSWSRRPEAGIYWVRLVQAGQGSRVTRVAILD